MNLQKIDQWEDEMLEVRSQCINVENIITQDEGEFLTDVGYYDLPLFNDKEEVLLQIVTTEKVSTNFKNQNLMR